MNLFIVKIEPRASVPEAEQWEITDDAGAALNWVDRARQQDRPCVVYKIDAELWDFAE